MEPLTASSKDSAVRGMEIFLKTFSFVPDDKLNWAPAPTAKSPIRIAAHTALYAGRFASMIEDRKAAADNLEELLARWNAEETALTDRDEIERVFRKNTDRVLAALDSLDPEAIGMTIDSGVGFTMPMTFLMSLPGHHALAHAAQIDYLQTCWDDQEVHF